MTNPLSRAFATIVDRFKDCLPRRHKHNSIWDTIPLDIKFIILELVDQPQITGLVSREWYAFSTCDAHYNQLLKHYSTCAFLALFRAPQGLPSQNQVERTHQQVVSWALKKNVDIEKLQTIPHHPYSVEFLHQATELYRKKETIAFLLALDPRTIEYPPDFTDDQILECYERDMGQFPAHYAEIEELNLWNRRLTHLPSQIGRLTGLRTLDISDNRIVELPPEMKNLTLLEKLILKDTSLSPESVREVCQALPHLKTVIVGHSDTALITLFRKSFPKLNLFVTQLIVVDDPL